MPVILHYIGHSCFFIENEQGGILIDPFISQNPQAISHINPSHIKDIILTHGHSDHLGDAIPLSIKTGVKITATFELANYCSNQGAQVNTMNLGGKIELTSASAKFLPAFHSSSATGGKYTGMPAAVLVDIGGYKIYHAGDTCLNAEMKVAGEVYKPDVALLPIGSTFTMDIDDAVIAAKWLEAKIIVPMHYNTFPAISADVTDFKKKIENLGKRCLVMNPGESIQI